VMRGRILAIACLAGASLACSAMETVRDAAVRAAGVEERTGTGPEGLSSGPSSTPGPVGVGNDGDTLPGLSIEEWLVLAYPRQAGREKLGENRVVGGYIVAWPDMKYLGEGAEIAGAGYEPVSVTPTEIRIVPGTSVPVSYSPELDVSRPEPEGSAQWFRGRLDRPVMLIPPNASLVMVRVETDPSLGQWTAPGEYQCPDEAARWAYGPDDFRLGYPGLGETEVYLSGDGFWFGEFQSPAGGYRCPGNGWLYFILPGVELDPSLIWLEYTGHIGHGQLAFWTLTERP
jgi:hypothetical protein